MVLESHSVEQVKELVSFLIEYIKDDLPIEKWEEQSPERVVRLVKVMLNLGQGHCGGSTNSPHHDDSG